MQRILQPGEIEALDRTAFPRIRLPQPASLFRDRANRLRQLAEGSPMDGFLRYVARIMDAQHEVAGRMPQAPDPDADTIERAQRYAMPLWQLPADLASGWQQALQWLLDIMREAPETGPLQRQHIDELAAMDERALLQLIDAVLLGAPMQESRRIKAPFVMAAVQVAMTVRAARLDLRQLPYVDPPTVCPVCSSQPVASVVRIDGQSAGLRYLHCGVCATEWHMVRVKCSNCASTKGISYRRVGLHDDTREDAESAVATMAELCANCGSYRKIFDLQKDPMIEVLSDDLATLMLDLLMGEENHARAGLNPFLYLGAADDAETGAGAGAGGEVLS